MGDNPFGEKIQQLKEGKITEIAIERNEFDLFRDCWQLLPDRAKIVGEAGLDGKIIYRWVD